MLITHRGFVMFKDYDLETNLRKFLSDLEKEIESDRTVLQANEEEYIKHKIEKYEIAPLILHSDQITVSQKEINIPARYFPSGFWVDAGKSYPKPVLTFHIPFEGNPQWLKCKPSTFLLWTDEVSVSNNEILFEIINFSNDAGTVKRERDEFMGRLSSQITNINQGLNAYNSKLEKIIKESIDKAKVKFKDQDDFLSTLGTPQK
jgi:hypothetical protein